MKWRITPQSVYDKAEWHKVFLWTPIQHGDYKYWLCFMWRRAEFMHYGLQIDGTYMVRQPSDYTTWVYSEIEY